MLKNYNDERRWILFLRIVIGALIFLIAVKAVRYYAYYKVASAENRAEIQRMNVALSIENYYNNHYGYLPPLENSKNTKRILSLSEDQYNDPVSHRPWLFNSHLSGYTFKQIEAKCGDVPPVLAYSQPLNIFGDRLVVLTWGIGAMSGEEYNMMAYNRPESIDPIFQLLFHDGEQHSEYMEVAFDPSYGRK